MGRYKELAYTIAENLAKLDMALNDGEPAENIYPICHDAVEPWACPFTGHMLISTIAC